MSMTQTPTLSELAIGRTVRANLSTAELYEHAIRAGEGIVAAEGPLVVRTGKHTGRSPKDKFVVVEPTSEAKIWWGDVNQRISEEHYDRLRARLLTYVATRDLYAQDAFIGAHPAHRRSLRVYTETAWASIFAENLFRRPTAEELATFAPNFTILDVPVLQGRSGHRGHPHRDRDPGPRGPDGDRHRRHRVRRRDQEVGLHGHELPDARRGRAAHALLGQRREQAATRSSSSASRGPGRPPSRPTRCAALIGDDEHGWGDGYVFNFEGGCYAKTIRLSPMYEPDIFATTRRFGTILENVDLDPVDPRARPRFRADHREHPRRLPAPLHRQRRPHRRSPGRRSTSSS